jgi:hypothetical protein
MAATVCRSEQAIAASRFVIKVFVRLAIAGSDGANLPSLIDARGLLPLESSAHRIDEQAEQREFRVLDAIADPDPDHGARRGPRHRRRGPCAASRNI